MKQKQNSSNSWREICEEHEKKQQIIDVLFYLHLYIIILFFLIRLRQHPFF